jgi:hypothetical protein
MSMQSGALDPGLLAYLQRTEELSSREFDGQVGSLANLRQGTLGEGLSEGGIVERAACFCTEVQKWLGRRPLEDAGLPVVNT